MPFTLGLITGIVISILVVVTLMYFRKVIESKITVIEKNVSNAAPRPKGFIFDPPDEVEDARQSIIDRNKKLGKDTHISELR